MRILKLLSVMLLFSAFTCKQRPVDITIDNTTGQEYLMVSKYMFDDKNAGLSPSSALEDERLGIKALGTGRQEYGIMSHHLSFFIYSDKPFYTFYFISTDYQSEPFADIIAGKKYDSININIKKKIKLALDKGKHSKLKITEK